MDRHQISSQIDLWSNSTLWNSLRMGLGHARVGGAAVALTHQNDQMILFAGGTDGLQVRSDCELFDCSTLMWRQIASMLHPRVSFQVIPCSCDDLI